LPKNVAIEDIRDRLSKIFDNCGGKVVYVHYGRALIRFPCKDDAQRALQRFNGEDCFGQKLKLSLTNVDPKQVKESHVNDFSVPIPVSNDCKSVIRGLETKKDQNLTELVRKIVSDWNDSQINSNLIVSVERNTKRAQEDGKVTLFVTAVNAEASKKLINGAQKYLNASHGVKWTEFRKLKPQINGDQTVSSNDNNNSGMKSLNNATSVSNLSKQTENWNQLQTNSMQQSVSDDCLSVIRGLNSGQKDDVLLKVRSIVCGWNDPKISAEDIVAVSRHSKWQLRDGKAMLFVTAKNRDKNKLIIRKAETCFNNTEEKLLWNEYSGKA
jgi:RNA recognition motif-containing protein